MVFEKVKELFSGNDEKYEILYYKYSKIKLENQKLKNDHYNEMQDYKSEVHSIMANHLINIFEDIEDVKNSSFKIKAMTREEQTLLINLNKLEKNVKSILKKFSIEAIDATERFYDPELHDIASYQESKGMKSGLILKTLKKGYKYRNKIIKKPKLVVSR